MFIKTKIVILPGSIFDMIFNFIVGAAYILSFFLTSFVIGSRLSFLENVYSIEIAIDFILFIDMILRFITAYENDCEYIVDLKAIAVNYLSNKFIFDVIGIIPGLVTFELFPQLYFLKVCRYLQLGRFFDKIDNMLKIISQKSKMCSKSSARTVLSITKLIIVITLLIHIFVSIWLWISDTAFNGNDIGGNYIIAFYFITETFASVGYGDITPIKNQEILYVIFIELVGLTLFAYLRGSFANISLSRSARNIINQKKQNIENFLNIISYGRRDITNKGNIV